MCRWCIDKPVCPCQVECEVALSTAHIGGDAQIICPKCNHNVIREYFVD